MTAEAGDVAPVVGAEKPSLQAWYALAVLVIATLFGVADRQILVLVTEPLKHDLHLADVQIGALQGIGPGLFAALAAIPVGWLADRIERRLILVVCVIVWSLATAACGLAQSFPTLFLSGIGVAIGESALGPMVYSLIPDLFPGESRLRANFIFFGAVTLGAGIGIAASGGVLALMEANRHAFPAALQHIAAWRLAFFAVATPGALVALSIAWIGKIRRQTANPNKEAPAPLGDYLRRHGRTLGLFYVGMGVFGAASYAIYAWTPVFIVRTLHATPGEVGGGIGLAFILGSISGLLLAASSVKFWTRRAGFAGPLRGLQVSMFVATAPTLLLVFVQASWQAYGLVGLQIAALTAGASLIPTLLQNLSPNHLRGRIIAISSLISVIFGAGSPIIVGALSDTFGHDLRALLWAIVAVTATALVASATLFKFVEPSFRRTADAIAAEAA